MNSRYLAWSVVLVLLAGCGSTPQTEWFVLAADGPVPVDGSGQTLGIVSLEVAEYLLAPQMLSMDGSNRLRRSEFARWGEPLDEGVARVLSLDLASVLGTQAVRLAPWPREWVPRHELRLRIQQLDARDDRVELVAAWSLSPGNGGGVTLDRMTRLSRPRTGDDPASVAGDFSALLAELARSIAAEIPAAAN